MNKSFLTLDRFQLAQAYRETAQTGVLASFWKRRWQRSGEMAGWLVEQQLPAFSQQRGLVLYRAAGGRKAPEFATNSLADVVETIEFLLYDTITLEARFNECVAEGGAYKLPGAGKEFISYLLCLQQPALLGIWNQVAERGLRRLGRYPKSMGAGHWGLRYLDLLDATHRLRPEFGLADFREVDEFLYFVTRGDSSGAGNMAVAVAGENDKTHGNKVR